MPSLYPTSSPHSPGICSPQGPQWLLHHCPCCQLWRSAQASTSPWSWGQQECSSFWRQAVNIKQHTPASGMLTQPSPQISPTAPSQLQEPKGGQALHLHGVYNPGSGTNLAQSSSSASLPPCTDLAPGSLNLDCWVWAWILISNKSERHSPSMEKHCLGRAACLLPTLQPLCPGIKPWEPQPTASQGLGSKALGDPVQRGSTFLRIPTPPTAAPTTYDSSAVQTTRKLMGSNVVRA